MVSWAQGTQATNSNQVQFLTKLSRVLKLRACDRIEQQQFAPLTLDISVIYSINKFCCNIYFPNETRTKTFLSSVDPFSFQAPQSLLLLAAHIRVLCSAVEIQHAGVTIILDNQDWEIRTTDLIQLQSVWGEVCQSFNSRIYPYKDGNCRTNRYKQFCLYQHLGS